MIDKAEVDDIEQEFADVDISNDSSLIVNSLEKVANTGSGPSDHQDHLQDKVVIGSDGEEDEVEDEADEEEKVPTPTMVLPQNNGFNSDPSVLHVSFFITNISIICTKYAEIVML